MSNSGPADIETLFENTFQLEDLFVFDNATLRSMLLSGSFDLTAEHLGLSLHGAPPSLVKCFMRNLPPPQRSFLQEVLCRPVTGTQVEAARKQILDKLFWELTYWKTPELYEELTAGEQLHPGIFQQLEPDLRGKVVLDAGAGSGRATFECLRHGARLVYAVEPSPGLLHILEQKVASQPAINGRIVARRGHFADLPLQDRSVDFALSCSAFTAEAEQGGEPGLEELQRVTRPGGKIVVIWPRIEDHEWLAAHGFVYVALPVHQDMAVHFRSRLSALKCAQRFYTHNEDVIPYILKHQTPEVPFSVLGINPPCDYCWLTVQDSGRFPIYRVILN
jgi:ubiquinone/menaquinone biosynthesis C-methylase UbiE